MDVTAAHIGNNKWYWETIDSVNEEDALKIMKANHYITFKEKYE